MADRENMISCVKCGTCRTVCPVNSVCPGEANSARGKMALVEAVSQGHLEGSGLYREYLETCLLCGACEEACPSGVPTLSIMFRARQDLTENEGPGRGKVLLIKALVGIPRLLDLVMRTGKAFQGVMFRRIPTESGLRRRFPMPLIPPDRTLPGVAQRFFTDDYRGLVRRGTGPRVGIFAGCMTNYLYPGIGAGMVELLAARNATVVVPTDQVCCGMPALTGGARKTARELALRNLEAFEAHDLDVVVTGCASCGSNLKENYNLLLAEADVDGSRRERFLAGIMDINEFL
ncbi:MAG: (Fe-S)-binding protein, partial [bacterium]